MGEIVVDDYSRTNVGNIWAVGDVTDRVQLTPVAIHEAMCFVETEFRGNPTAPDYDCDRDGRLLAARDRHGRPVGGRGVARRFEEIGGLSRRVPADEGNTLSPAATRR